MLATEGPSYIGALIAVNGVAIPIRGGQQFTQLDNDSAGYKAFSNIKGGDAAIVSGPVKDYLTDIVSTGPIILTPATGPNDVVRENGKIMGVKRLEYHPYRTLV